MLTARGVGGPEVASGDAGPSSSGPDDSVTNTGSCATRKNASQEHVFTLFASYMLETPSCDANVMTNGQRMSNAGHRIVADLHDT